MKDAGNFDVHIASLNWNKYIQQNIQHFLLFFYWYVFILHCFVHISFSDFFKNSIFINLWEIKTWKTPRKIIIILMLGWFLYLSIAFKVRCIDRLCGSLSSTVFRNFEIFSEVWEKLYRVIATFTASDVIYSSFTKIVFSLNLFLSLRRGLTVCQNILLSVISFSFRFAKCSFFPFVSSDKTKFPLLGIS